MSFFKTPNTSCTDEDTDIEYIESDDFVSTRDELETSIQQSEELLRLILEEKESLRQMVARQENIHSINKGDVIQLRKQLEMLKNPKLPLTKELNEQNEQNARICNFINEKTQEMFAFVMKNFPSPNIDSEELVEISPEMANFTLADLIEKLIRRWEESPDPYVDVDDTVWPPYIELLLRFHVIKRRPNDPSKICLLSYD